MVHLHLMGQSMPFPDTNRRRFVQGLAAGGIVTGLGAWPAVTHAATSGPVLRSSDLHLRIGEQPVNFTGKARTAVTVNGRLPAPEIRWREGDTVTVRVDNLLPRGSLFGDSTSIHWHGILLPANMDGVPGMSFDGIRRGEQASEFVL